MTSRPQDEVIERLALTHGRVAVRDGFADKHIDVTVEGGQCFHVNADGIARQVGGNYSIDWTT